jgi:hypothetical protein
MRPETKNTLLFVITLVLLSVSAVGSGALSWLIKTFSSDRQIDDLDKLIVLMKENPWTTAKVAGFFLLVSVAAKAGKMESLMNMLLQQDAMNNGLRASQGLR